MVDTPESPGTGGGSSTPPRDRLQPGDPAVTEIVTMAASLLDTVRFRARKRDQSTLAKGPELELLQSVYVLQARWLARREARTIRTSASHEEIASEAKRLLGRELVLSATQVSKFAANWNTALKDGIEKRGSSNDGQYEGAVTFRYDGGNGRSAFWFDLAEVIQHEGEPERREIVIRPVRFIEKEVPLARLLDATAEDPPYEDQALGMGAAAKKGDPKALRAMEYIKRFGLSFIIVALVFLGYQLLPAEAQAWILERFQQIRGWIETDVTPTPVERGDSKKDRAVSKGRPIARDSPVAESETSSVFPRATAVLGFPGGAAYRAVVSDERLYVAGSDGLRIYGLQDPAKPAWLRTLTFTIPAADVAVLGSVAFVALGAQGVAVVDVSNPATPMARTWLRTRGIDVALTLSGTRLFVLSGGQGVLRSYDVCTPTEPVFEGSTELGLGVPEDVVVVGRCAYVAERRRLGHGGGLVVVDIGQPENPMVVGTLVTSRDGHAIEIVGPNVRFANDAAGILKVTKVGPYAYLASDTAGLIIVDVANPTQPTEVGTIPTDGAALAVAAQGSTAYVGMGAGGSDEPGGITMVDISKVPRQTVTVGSVVSPWAIYGLALEQGFAYAPGNGTLTVMKLPSGS